ncbi:MAG: hypothetical protein WD226_12230 [Planctomycetota bacterium]
MAEQANGKAVISLVFGILGIAGVCPIIGSVVAIVVGKDLPEDGVAKAGVILGWIGLALTALALLAFFVMLAMGVGLAAVQNQ